MRNELIELINSSGKKATAIDEIKDGLVSRKFETADINEVAKIIVKNFDNVDIYSVETISCQSPIDLSIGESIIVRMITKKGE